MTRPKGYISYALVSLFPPLLSSLADIEYESVPLREGAELLVFDLGHLVEALVLVLPLWPLPLCLLGVDREVLEHHSRGTKVSCLILLML